MSTHTKQQPPIAHFKIAIIGTGFSGIGMAMRLKQQNEDDFVLFEKDQGVGGTWRVNNYPGCACDVQSHLYSFSFEPNPSWTRMFAAQPEIKGYLESCWSKYQLSEHTRFGCEISRLSWDEEHEYWQLTDQNGISYTAQFVVSGMGALSKPSIPHVKGLEHFSGKVFHSQQWDHDYDLKGKRVAVIGTGASAIQFVPYLQKTADHLDLYQRTPPWILPKPDRAISERERNHFQRFPTLQKLWRLFIYSLLESRVIGFALLPKAMTLAQKVAKWYINKQIKDPALRSKVTPDYLMGCKRILMSNDYYPALTQSNVEVITDGISEVSSGAILGQDGVSRTVDAIIFGTGFTPTAPIPQGVIFGRNGLDLIESWSQGPHAYKGTMTSGFPNLFFLMGPNTGLGHNSMVYMIESQINYVLAALKELDRLNLQSLEVKQEVESSFNSKLQGSLSHTVWNTGGCQSWYLHPVSGINCTTWPGFTWRFRLITNAFDSPSYHYSRKNPVHPGQNNAQSTLNKEVHA
jgi:cation diffusion facilitator CzcD-associated flavoprotein CzcO